MGFHHLQHPLEILSFIIAFVWPKNFPHGSSGLREK